MNYYRGSLSRPYMYYHRVGRVDWILLYKSVTGFILLHLVLSTAVLQWILYIYR